MQALPLQWLTHMCVLLMGLKVKHTIHTVEWANTHALAHVYLKGMIILHVHLCTLYTGRYCGKYAH